MLRHLHLTNIAKKMIGIILYIWILIILTFLLFNFSIAEDWVIIANLGYLCMCISLIIVIRNHKENVKLPKINRKL